MFFLKVKMVELTYKQPSHMTMSPHFNWKMMIIQSNLHRKWRFYIALPQKGGPLRAHCL